MRKQQFVLALALLAAPAPALVAQTPQAPDTSHRQHQARGERQGPRGPIAGLLQHREQLGLSADQVARLESIQAELRTKNQPLMQQLQQARGQRGEGRPQDPPTAEQREAFRERRAQLEPVMKELRANAASARERVDAVLTAEQKEKVKELRPKRGERGERGQRGEGRRGRGERAPRASTPSGS